MGRRVVVCGDIAVDSASTQHGRLCVCALLCDARDGVRFSRVVDCVGRCVLYGLCGDATQRFVSVLRCSAESLLDGGAPSHGSCVLWYLPPADVVPGALPV